MRKILLTLALIVSFNTAVVAQNKLLNDLGLSLNLLLAGFFGSLLLVQKEGKTWKENIMTLVTGSFTAGYLGGFISESLNITSQYGMGTIGFLTGFGGYRLADLLLDKFLKNIKNDKSN